MECFVWHVRGINDKEKQDCIRDKITESAASIVCLQETKREAFDNAYISKFCSRHLSKFCFSPSAGTSGGLLTIWNGCGFDDEIICINVFPSLSNSLLKHLISLTNIYAPSSPAEKASFVIWLYIFDVSDFENWMLVGEFNFIRSQGNRNNPGGSVSDMLVFNDLIQHLDVIDIPFECRDFTWSNMQIDPLLEKTLDWVFTSALGSAFSRHQSSTFGSNNF